MKTQRKFLIVALGMLFISSSLVKAQSFSAGVSGGIVTGSVKLEKLDSGITDVINGRNISGFTLGLYAMPDFDIMYIRPELDYVFRHGPMQRNEVKSNLTMHKLEVPVIVGLRLVGPLGVEAGPVYNFLLAVNESEDGNVAVGKSGVGYRAGVILKFNDFFINGSYGGATYSKGNVTTIREPSKLMFGLGLRLGGTGSGTGDR